MDTEVLVGSILEVFIRSPLSRMEVSVFRELQKQPASVKFRQSRHFLNTRKRVGKSTNSLLYKRVKKSHFLCETL